MHPCEDENCFQPAKHGCHKQDCATCAKQAQLTRVEEQHGKLVFSDENVAIRVKKKENGEYFVAVHKKKDGDEYLSIAYMLGANALIYKPTKE